MRPRTKGETLAGGYLPHSRSIVLLDTNGNIISLYKPSKKWKKKVILSALK
jgi:catechol-2,3-dioxygenase